MEDELEASEKKCHYLEAFEKKFMDSEQLMQH